MTVCLDEMGLEAAKSYAGRALVHQPDGKHPAERARLEADYGRRGKATFSVPSAPPPARL